MKYLHKEWLGLWCLMPHSTIFQLEDSFIGGGIRGTRNKPLTCRKSLTNYMYYMLLYRVHAAMSEIRTHNFDGF